jgi:type II secretory pathway component PulK
MYSPRTRRAHGRAGYALLLALVVATITGFAVLGILNTVRFETMEMTARKQSDSAAWAARAGVEYGIARLLDNPNLRGPLSPLSLPPASPNQIQVTIQQNGQNLTVMATATAGGLSETRQTDFTVGQLQQRISSLPR